MMFFKGTNPTGEVTLSCGTSALTVSSQNPSSLPTCPVEGDTTTNLPTAGISTEDSTTLTSLTTDSSNLSSSTQDELTTSSDTPTTSDVNTTSLFSTDMTTEVNVTVDSERYIIIFFHIVNPSVWHFFIKTNTKLN